jgi:S-adenosylmethionine hydrolase
MIITLLTDFGYSDPYAGIMKGVILEINPNVQVVDVSHGISPQNMNEAAYILKSAYPYFPRGTIHVVVVDPGVGSKRAVLAVQTDSYRFLAPDNGVLKYVFDKHPEAKVVRVTNPLYFLDPVSRTFHGRDIFAPTAAYWAKGISIEKMGEPCDSYIRGEVNHPIKDIGTITGSIIYIDGFGNGITNISEAMIENKKNVRIKVNHKNIDRICLSYQDVAVGEPLALIGSQNTLEISVRNGNAQKQLNLHVGDTITIKQL